LQCIFFDRESGPTLNGFRQQTQDELEMDAGRSENESRATRVIKFGGTSVTGGDRIDTIAGVVRDRLKTKRPVLVVSAFAHITTLLETTALAARSGEHHTGFAELRTVHLDAIESMTRSAPTSSLVVELLLAECFECLEAIASTGDCSHAAMDEVLSFGERLSSSIIAQGLSVRGIDATPVDAAALVVTDANFGRARADLEATRLQAEAVLPGPSTVPVVTGFIGATPDRRRTTLGREGSDYTAAVLGWALDADEVEIWTDVDGVKTADPRVVDAVVSLRHLTYDALFELASHGAKVVHPNTLRPVQERGIPLSIRNTLSPYDPGTRVGCAEAPPASTPEWLGVTQMASEAVLDGRPLDDALSWVRETETPFSVITVIRNVETGVARSKGSDPNQSYPSGIDERGSHRVARKALEVAAALVDAGVRVVNPPAGSSPADTTGRSISFVVPPEDANAAVRVAHACLFAPGSETTPTDRDKRVRSAKARLSPAGCDS